MTLNFLFGCRYSLGRNCSGCPSLKFTLIHPLEFRAMTTTFESRVYYLPSKNPHTQEGWGTLSISLEIIKFDTYRDIGKKKIVSGMTFGHVQKSWLCVDYSQRHRSNVHQSKSFTATPVANLTHKILLDIAVGALCFLEMCFKPI